jgi:hypothetical protein
MSRSAARLRNAFFGMFLASSMAFGSAQAFATPRAAVPIPVACNPYDKFSTQFCSEVCGELGYNRGYCAGSGGCWCMGG